MRLEWSGRAERGSAPHRAALVARCNDDGDGEREDGDDNGDGDDGDERNGRNDGDDDSGGGEPAGDTRDGIRRVRASARRNLSRPLTALDCTRRCSAFAALGKTRPSRHTHGTGPTVLRRSIVNFFYSHPSQFSPSLRLRLALYSLRSASVLSYEQ